MCRFWWSVLIFMCRKWYGVLEVFLSKDVLIFFSDKQNVMKLGKYVAMWNVLNGIFLKKKSCFGVFTLF